MKKRKPKPVLQGHKKKGSKFFPPFLARTDSFNIKEIDWRREILPELFWLAPLVHDYGLERARIIACAFIRIINDDPANAGWAGMGLASAIGTLSEGAKNTIRDRLRKTGVLEDLVRPLEPLFTLYPDFPLLFLRGDDAPTVDKEKAIDHIGPLLYECLFRREKLPTLIQGVFFDMALASGRMHFAQGIELHDTQNLEEYPDSDLSRFTASAIRAFVSTIPNLQRSSAWPESFWQQGNNLGGCYGQSPGGPVLSDYKQASILYESECFGHYDVECQDLWDSITNSRTLNIYKPLRDEVLMGLACRIYRLTVQIVSFRPNWTEDIGQVFLRMVVESYIIWKWLKSKGTDSDFNEYYEHGLGQQKLHMEHVESYLASHGIAKADIDTVNPGLHFLRNHKMKEFITVNVGNAWSKDLRKISEEIDLKELHSLVFGPTSSVVHGSYDCIEKYYMRRCQNPFHCLHLVPYYWSKNPVSEYGPANVLQIMDWVFEELTADTGVPAPEPLPGQQYLERLHDEERFKEYCQNSEVLKKIKFREELVEELVGGQSDEEE